MQLTFQSLTLERFRSFTHKSTLYFDSCGAGLYFLKGNNKTNRALGSNGSGKSSLVDAFLWCLYGKTVQGLRNPDITPWSGKGKTVVQIDLLVDDQPHKIVRTANPNLLQLDDREVGQDAIEKLLGLPFEIVPYTIILGQKRPLFFDLQPREKLALFTDILNLEKWEKYSTAAYEAATRTEKDINADSIEIDSLERQKEQITSDIKSLKEKSQEWEEQRAQRIEQQEKEKKSFQKRIDSVQSERDKADLQYDGALTELQSIQPGLQLKEVQLRKLRAAISNMQREHTLRHAEQEQIESTLQALDNEKCCPTCQQPLKSPAKIKQLKDDLQAKLKQCLDPTADKKLAQEQKQLDTLEKAVTGLQEAQHRFEKTAREARSILDRLDPQIAEWTAQISALNKLKDEQADSNNPYTEQIQTLRRRFDIIGKDLRKLDEQLKVAKEYLERVKFWVKGFKDIKLYVIEEILQELEITTNSMCEEFGLLNWQVKYDIERETKSGTISRGLNVVVLSPYNKQPVKWECWSGGEGQRLRIIGAAALSSVLLNHAGVSSNLEVLDEPTESLSQEGVRDLVELLAQRAKVNEKNIWFVDHHVVESAHFVDVVTVVKDEHGSKVVN